MRSGSRIGSSLLPAVFGVLICWVSGARAGDLYVICNADVSLQPRDLRDVFVGEKAFAESVKIVPADNREAQAEFLAKVLKIDSARYNVLWTKKSFRDGVNPPPQKANDAEALAFVKATSGACSYVTHVAGGVQVIAKY